VNLAEKLVMRPIGALVPYATNSRTHTPEQKISKIARNVEAFGFTNRILRAQKRLRTALMWCVRTRSSAPRRLCRDGALHQSLGVDPVITPAYRWVRNTGLTWSDRTPVRAFRLSLLRQFSMALAGTPFKTLSTWPTGRKLSDAFAP